jgi:putative PIN family toxin of toxin-antitoxin system
MSDEKRRVVLDTNVLVAAAYAERSASRRILEGCLRGELTAILSPDLEREYGHIAPRAVHGRNIERTLQELLRVAQRVQPQETPRIVPDDPDDDKLIAAARAAGADAVVTNDRHLLTLDPLGPLRVLRPVEFVRLWAGA